MKVYLDDERATPDGWVRAWWPVEVIELLKTGQVSELSLTTTWATTSAAPATT